MTDSADEVQGTSGSAFQFNPPPGWPPVPDGWLPPTGWTPDPSWPAAPTDHEWYIPVEATTPSADIEVMPSPEVETPPDAEVSEAEAEAEIEESRQDIQEAVRRMGRTLGIKRELRTLESRLDPGETVMDIGRVKRAGHGCMLAITSRRLLFVRQGMIRETVEEMHTKAITSVKVRRRLMNGYIDVTVASKEETWEMTSAAHAQRVSETLRLAVRLATEAPASAVIATTLTAPSPAPVDVVAKIRELGALRDEGLITPDEFDQQKAKILGA